MQGTRIYFDTYWNDHCYGTSRAADVSALPACLLLCLGLGARRGARHQHQAAEACPGV